MADPFLAEIRIVGFNFAPRGWAFCDGQILPINQNQSLYSLLGTTYGGDGRTTFGLPELRGRTPIHVGNGFALGAKDGEETHSLTVDEMPGHGHSVRGSSDEAVSFSPNSLVVFAESTDPIYHSPAGTVNAAAGTISNAGAGSGHENMQPYVALNFCIALQGLFPSR